MSLSYEVFLSFRGEDTRRTIVSHLYKELVNKGIATFKDDPGIQMGDTISEKLIRVINNSKFAVVIISENFATSTWCLEELRLIMELEKEKEIEVIPLFYGVDPSDVRHYRGKFDLESYQNHEKAEMIPKWKEALQLISGRNGAVSLNCTEEATMIEDIVKQISSRLLSLLSIDLKCNIFGLEDYMKVLEPMLNMESMDDTVRMIGICGIEGIGKTTIASYVYEKLKHQFSTHHCFIEDIGGLVKLPNGLLELQKRLVSDVISEHNADLKNKETGARFIEKRLKYLKVLIVLDNVDNRIQLRYLARHIRWFGEGSRIIITTRNKNLLSPYEVRNVYDVKRLNDENALQLFKEIAFQGERPPSHHLYNHLSHRISWYAQGLPSTLLDLGSRFRNTPLEQWQGALDSLDKAYQDKIKSILRNSYESLNEFCKTVFLHVACLFNGYNVARVESLFNRDQSWVRVLAEKSLVSLSSDRVIAMPSLVEEIGKEIVRQSRGVENNPANQRILWHHDDIYQVVADKSGTSNTEGLAVDVGELLGEMPNCIHIEWDAFKQMHNLIFLKIYNNSGSNRKRLILERNLCVPRRLRLLDWDAYPFTALPSMIRPDSLVELNMRNSKLTTLWSGNPELLNLRRMDLTGSKDLKQLPDLAKAEYMEELILKGCTSLERIPKSICSLSKLQKIDVSNCKGLKRIMIKIRESHTTIFQDTILPVRSVQLAFSDAETPPGTSFTNLSIQGKLNIEFHFLRGSADQLCFISDQLTISMLEQQPLEPMSSLPYACKSLDIMRFHCTRKSGQFECVHFLGFPWLMELNLINLNIQDIPYSIHDMVVLEKLDLSGNSFKNLPSSMNYLSKLKHLTLCNCRELKQLPELYQLENLILSDCTSLKTLATSLSPLYHGTYNLLELWLDNCKSVEDLSYQLRGFQKLRYLDISRHDFRTVPTSINSLTSLVTLCLNYCNNLKSLTDIPQNVKSLKTHGCNSLQTPPSSTDICLHPKQNTSQITRFPAGRRGEEVPMCDCFEKTKTNETSIWSGILKFWPFGRTI